MPNKSQRPRSATTDIFPISGGSNMLHARPEIAPCGRACPAEETARIQPSIVRAMVAWIKRWIEAKRAHRLERFTAAHLSSLCRHTPDDMGFDTADHNRNWPQLLDTNTSDIVMEALREKSRHG